VIELAEKLFGVHDALSAASLPHAFGGAIALAYCVEEPRGTRDLDVNIFSNASNAAAALDALPDDIKVTDADIAAVERDGQKRFFWDGVPIDLFLNNLPLHDDVADRIVWVEFVGRQIPVLDCASLAVFKSFFNRTKDWADLEAVAAATPRDIEAAASTLAELVGEDDPSYKRLSKLAASNSSRGQ
jgi:hypothetical protein